MLATLGLSLYTGSNPLNFFGLGSLLLILVPPNF